MSQWGADFDAIIVGSGPGGSTVADVLTAAGWSVLILERGRNHLIDLSDPTRLGTDFSNDEIKFMMRHFLGPDPLVEPRTFRQDDADGDRLHVGEVNSVPGDGGRRRRPRRRQAPAIPGDGLPPADRAWPDRRRRDRRLAAHLRRARAVLRRCRAHGRRVRRRRGQPLRRAAFGSLPDAAGRADVRRHPHRGGRGAFRPPSVRRADGRELRPLRGPPGVQQLRLLLVLRLPHPRQG